MIIGKNNVSWTRTETGTKIFWIHFKMLRKRWTTKTRWWHRNGTCFSHNSHRGIIENHSKICISNVLLLICSVPMPFIPVFLSSSQFSFQNMFSSYAIPAFSSSSVVLIFLSCAYYLQTLIALMSTDFKTCSVHMPSPCFPHLPILISKHVQFLCHLHVFVVKYCSNSFDHVPINLKTLIQLHWCLPISKHVQFVCLPRVFLISRSSFQNMFSSYAISVFSSSSVRSHFFDHVLINLQTLIQLHWCLPISKHVQFVCHPHLFLISPSSFQDMFSSYAISLFSSSCVVLIFLIMCLLIYRH
jgi:hypothetical protein